MSSCPAAGPWRPVGCPAGRDCWPRHVWHIVWHMPDKQLNPCCSTGYVVGLQIFSVGALVVLTLMQIILSYTQVTDEGVEGLAGMTSLVALSVIGCHRLTPKGKQAVARLLDNAIS